MEMLGSFGISTCGRGDLQTIDVAIGAPIDGWRWWKSSERALTLITWQRGLHGVNSPFALKVILKNIYIFMINKNQIIIVNNKIIIYVDEI